jgi:hypothetical protein
MLDVLRVALAVAAILALLLLIGWTMDNADSTRNTDS